ncbi:hypothetical protein D3C78_1287190 [compost metagenome]
MMMEWRSRVISTKRTVRVKMISGKSCLSANSIISCGMVLKYVPNSIHRQAAFLSIRFCINSKEDGRSTLAPIPVVKIISSP